MGGGGGHILLTDDPLLCIQSAKLQIRLKIVELLRPGVNKQTPIKDEGSPQYADQLGCIFQGGLHILKLAKK